MKPLAIDLFCGLGGWTEGLLAEGYRVVGFDIEQHVYGEHRYPAQLVIQDVLTLHGSQFKTAALIVASPPCQEFSYMAMPWSKAKEKARRLETGEDDPKRLTALFDACFRIQREAIEAAGHHIPLVVENVRGAQKWVGKAQWHFGSFYLWGDVPALMPIAKKAIKVPTMGAGWHPPDHPKHVPGLAFNGHADRNLREGQKAPGKNWNEWKDWDGREETKPASVRPWGDTGQKTVGHLNKRDGHGHTRHLTNQAEHGVKVSGDWFGSYAEQKAAGTISPGRLHGKGSSARKAASAMIAKIPFVLSQHIARAWKPEAAA